MAEEEKKRADMSNEEAQEMRSKPSDEEIIEGEVVETAEEPEMIPAEALQQLSQQLEQVQNQGKEYFEGWQRERADFANYKRRIERDQQALAQNIKVEIIKKYLTVMDDMERALKVRPQDGPDAAWASGIELIYRKLKNILESEGVERIPAEKEEFDPNRHEAITYEESPDHKSGEIIEVIQQGYTLGDRIVRPAMVRVARG